MRAAWVPDILLVIAGEGPAMAISRRRRSPSAGLQARVQFIGYLDRQSELPDCYAAADVFVFASRTETQGLVLLEAMAAGLPVDRAGRNGDGRHPRCRPRRILRRRPSQGLRRDARAFSRSFRCLAPPGRAKRRLRQAEWSDVAMALGTIQ
jgi:hypothetical protein